MKDPSDPASPRKQPPVIRYAIILGVCVILAIAIGAIVGQRTENPQPSPVSSPQTGASTGPTPRY